MTSPPSDLRAALLSDVTWLEPDEHPGFWFVVGGPAGAHVRSATQLEQAYRAEVERLREELDSHRKAFQLWSSAYAHLDDGQRAKAGRLKDAAWGALDGS
jgi:hypothetical protein